MPALPVVPKPNPTGTRLVRLADIPREIRMQAAGECAREAKGKHERSRIFALALDPGDAGGRIAA
jgi:hypothetical protein